MQLGASKTSITLASSDEWIEETEAEVGTTNAWDGDLMDVNADGDDWSEFRFRMSQL